MKSRFIYILFAIMLVLLVNPLIRNMGEKGWFIATLLLVLIPIASLYAFAKERKHAIIIISFGAPFVILDAINMFITNRSLLIMEYGFAVILYCYVIILLLKYVLTQRVITPDMIYGAISIYLLIGFMWAGVYVILEVISPDSFSGLSGLIDLAYFSFVTLTSLGYGDVAPVSTLCKRIAILEAAAGAIFIAVIIALIVGRYMSQQIQHDLKEEHKERR